MMNIIQATIKKVDTFQRKHAAIGFPYAVIKKYGEDNGGYQSALISYYALLSLFPLLIVFTSLTQLLLKGDPALHARVSDSVTQYFPVVGNQLQRGVHSSSKTGLGLAISLLVTLYGARGGASALQYALSSIWHVPRLKRPGFLPQLGRNMGIIFGGGAGLIGAGLVSGYTNILGRGIDIRVLATLISLLIFWGTFIFIFKLAIAGNKTVRDVVLSAGVAAIGIQILQTLGGVILGHQLKGLDSVYGTFALAIGLLLWIYLQIQVVLYAVEIDVVRSFRLFPRSIMEPLTDTDKRALELQAEALTKYKHQSIGVSFKPKSN